MPMPTPVRPFADAAASRAPRPAWGLAASVLLHAGALATILWGTTAPEIAAGVEAATVYDVLMAEAPPGPEAPAEQAAAEPTAEPVVEPVVEPVAEPPVTEATPEPVPEPPPEPTAIAELPPEPAPEPIPEPPPPPPKPAIKRESAAKPPRLIAAASAHPPSTRPPSAAATAASGGGAAESAQAVSYAAEPTRQPPPKYPAAAQRRGLEGKVMLRVRVSPAGAVEGVELLSGSGAEILDEAAIQAVRGWTFRPAMRLGVAVAAVVDVPVRFRLDEQR
jgi:periplasmic protein TonB